jgi:hypothetical protein
MRIGSMLNPQAGGLPSSAAGPGTGFSPLGQIPGMGNPMPGVFPSMFPFAGGTQVLSFTAKSMLIFFPYWCTTEIFS